MKQKQQLFYFEDSLKSSCLRLRPWFLIGISLLFLTLPACSTIRLQINEYTQKKINLPNMISPEEDYNLLKDTACIITVYDESGAFFLGKDQVTKEQLGGKIVEKLRDQPPDKKIVYLETSVDVKYGYIVEVLNLIRKANIDKAGLVAERMKREKIGAVATRFEVKLPADPDNSPVILKPNPLTLVVEIEANGNVSLNKELKGSINNTDPLTNVLTQIFKDREWNGVFVENTNEIEKTVFIKAAKSVRYGDVIKVIDAVKIAGAYPIALQIDYLPN